jgi:hypothetical protein
MRAPLAARPILRRWRLAGLGALTLLLAVGFAPVQSQAAPSSLPRAFAGPALWVRETSPLKTGEQLVVEASRAGVRTLYVKAGDGVTPELRFSSELVGEMRSAGATVCAWMFAYGSAPTAEAAVAVAAVRAGAQCLVVDAEGQYDKLYGAAQQFVHALRSQLGAHFPIGLAGQAEVAQHPTFPYSVFLGPGAFNVAMPQVYWRDFGVSVDSAFAATIGINSIYGRPVLPVGQLFNSPQPRELLRFRTLAAAYGPGGWSFYDLDVAQPQQLAALAPPLRRIHRRAIAQPTLRPGADGDDVVQAQELLNAAGAHLPVGGFFGAVTARAVTSFQARRHLRATGVIDTATWKVLLRFHPLEPSWASGPPDSAR